MNPMFAVVFCLNYMMGSGFLTLPRAYVDCSVWLGVALTLVIALGATVSAECLLDVMARARYDVRRRGLPGDAGSFYRVPVGPRKVLRYGGLDDATARKTRDRVAEGRQQRFAQVSDLCTLYLGVAGNVFYLLMLVSFMFGSLWVYAAIFATSFRAHGGSVLFLASATTNPETAYRCYVLLFGILAVPLATLDLAEQKTTQTVLAAGRGVMLVLMTATAATALCSGGALGAPRPLDGYAKRVLSAAPIVAFSCTLHHSVPQICAPVRARGDDDDQHPDAAFALNWIFRAAFLAAAAIYVAFASTIALFFGDTTASAVNLDWASYEVVSASATARALGAFVAKFIVLYPAVNVVSAYPLSAITLGDALLAAYRQYVSPSADDAARTTVSCCGHERGGCSASTSTTELLPVVSDTSSHGALRVAPVSSSSPKGGTTPTVVIAAVPAPRPSGSPPSRTDSQRSQRSSTHVLGRNVEPGTPTTPAGPSLSRHAPPTRAQKVACRLVAALPPIAGALYADDISSITRVTGSAGLAMCAVVPALLAIVARRRTPGDTPHHSALNTRNAAIALLVVGSVLAATPVLSAASTRLQEDRANYAAGQPRRDHASGPVLTAHRSRPGKYHFRSTF